MENTPREETRRRKTSTGYGFIPPGVEQDKEKENSEKRSKKQDPEAVDAVLVKTLWGGEKNLSLTAWEGGAKTKKEAINSLRTETFLIGG